MWADVNLGALRAEQAESFVVASNPRRSPATVRVEIMEARHQVAPARRVISSVIADGYERRARSGTSRRTCWSRSTRARPGWAVASEYMRRRLAPKLCAGVAGQPIERLQI